MSADKKIRDVFLKVGDVVPFDNGLTATVNREGFYHVTPTSVHFIGPASVSEDWRVAPYDPVIDEKTDPLDRFLAGLPVGEVIAKLKEAAQGGKFMSRINLPVDPPARDLLIDIAQLSSPDTREYHEPTNGGRIDITTEREAPQIVAAPAGMTLEECEELARTGSVVLRPNPPFVKVTEVEGRLRRQGGHSCIDVGDPVRGTEMADISPDGAWGEDGPGPRGRFRVTVEFWPTKEG